MSSDEQWMRLALDEARIAGDAGDVPVGAIIVRGDDTILARGRNRREADLDPTGHAEIVALREAARMLGSWRVGATMYVTQEPCPMCAGALVNARVGKLVYGCTNPKAGAIETLFQIVTDARLNHRVEVVGGMLADDCAKILQTFFAQRR